MRPGTGREAGLGHERYAAGAGMRTTAGMQEVEQRRSSCRGAALVGRDKAYGDTCNIQINTLMNEVTPRIRAIMNVV